MTALSWQQISERPIGTGKQPSDELRTFPWAQSWKPFGREVNSPQIGDLLVFARHVTFYVGEDADHYSCLGGQSIRRRHHHDYRKTGCEAILRLPAASDVVEKIDTPSIALAVDEFHASDYFVATTAAKPPRPDALMPNIMLTLTMPGART